MKAASRDCSAGGLDTVKSRAFESRDGAGASDVRSASARSSSVAAPTGRLTIPLDLTSALAHLRPDEHTSIRLEGVPEGMQLSAGSGDANNVWSLTLADLDNLKVIAPAGYREHSPQSVSLIRRDPQGGKAETV